MDYSAEELKFNSDHFDVNNINNKISTVISWIKDRVFVNSSDKIHYVIINPLLDP